MMMIAGTSLQALPIQWSPLLNGKVTCLREAVIADGGVVVLPDHPFSLLRTFNATAYEFAHVYKSARQVVFPLREGRKQLRARPDRDAHPGFRTDRN
ncbi:MAG: hypothetical protein U0521_01425 [Anaerolineae bacterium]